MEKKPNKAKFDDAVLRGTSMFKAMFFRQLADAYDPKRAAKLPKRGRYGKAV